MQRQHLQQVKEMQRQQQQQQQVKEMQRQHLQQVKEMQRQQLQQVKEMQRQHLQQQQHPHHPQKRGECRPVRRVHAPGPGQRGPRTQRLARTLPALPAEGAPLLPPRLLPCPLPSAAPRASAALAMPSGIPPPPRQQQRAAPPAPPPCSNPPCYCQCPLPRSTLPAWRPPAQRRPFEWRGRGSPGMRSLLQCPAGSAAPAPTPHAALRGPGPGWPPQGRCE